MPSSTPLPDSGGQNTKRKQARKQPRWTLLNLLSTWFLTADGKALIVDPSPAGGASHEEWRELVKQILDAAGKNIPAADLAQPWGQLARRDFLNWCDEHLPDDQKPVLFGSRSDALEWHEFSKLFDTTVTETKSPSKRIEIVKSSEPSPQDDGDDTPPNGAA